MKRENKHFPNMGVSIFAILALAALLIPGSLPGTDNRPSVEGGDCRGCHGRARILPSDHPNTKGLNLSDCRECHNDPGSTLRGKISSSHAHNLAGVACEDCHGPGEFSDPVPQDRCLDCHGSPQEVAESTAGLEPNPHDSLHYGPDLDCDLCHHIHRESENFCNQCHEFDFVVP